MPNVPNVPDATVTPDVPWYKFEIALYLHMPSVPSVPDAAVTPDVPWYKYEIALCGKCSQCS